MKDKLNISPNIFLVCLPTLFPQKSTQLSGKVLVFRTYDGSYAKMEIISFYNNMDPSSDPYGGCFTFNYVY